MTIARPAGSGGGVTAAEVNLKFVWDVVSRIKIGGTAGLAYVVDADGVLIAHPDISLVLKKSDLSALPQVAALRQPGPTARPPVARDLKGEEVFAAHAPIPTLHWTVFVESPRAEAFAPLYATLQRTALLLVAALLISIAASFFLARALVRPLRALQEGAAQIGAGDLERHIEVRTGDELEGLAEQFNRMSAQLRESYAGPRAQGRAAHRRADRGARAADRDGRDPAGHQQLADRRAAGASRRSPERARLLCRRRRQPAVWLGADGADPAARAYRLRARGREAGRGDAVRSRSTATVGRRPRVRRAPRRCTIDDVAPLIDTHYRRRASRRRRGTASTAVLAVPMLRDGRGIGVIAVAARRRSSRSRPSEIAPARDLRRPGA